MKCNSIIILVNEIEVMPSYEAARYLAAKGLALSKYLHRFITEIVVSRVSLPYGV